MLDYTMNGGEEYILITSTLVEDIDNLPDASEVELYANSDNNILTNDDIYDRLEDIMFNGKFGVTFQPCDSCPLYLYRGTNIRAEFLPTNPDNELDILAKSFFMRGAMELVDSGYDYQITVKMSKECGMECLDSEAVVCEIFSFCPKTKSCRISHLHFKNITANQTVISKGCELYTREYSLDYDESIFRRVIANDEEKNVSSQLLNGLDCARTCSLDPDNSLPFQCKGFNLCVSPDKTISSCEFRSRHILEVPDNFTVKAKNCSYFSRDYFEDYLIHVNQSIKIPSSIPLTKSATAKECALMCSTMADQEACRGFEMCKDAMTPLKTKCTLLVYNETDPDMQLVPNTDCDHYSRLSLPKPHVVEPTTLPPGQTSTTGALNETTGQTTMSPDQVNTTGSVNETSGQTTTSPDQVNTTGSVNETSGQTTMSPDQVNTTGSVNETSGQTTSSPDQVNTTGSVNETSGKTAISPDQDYTTGSVTESSATQPTGETTTPAMKKTVETGYSSGAMAGLGVGMTVFGFFLGAVLMILFVRVKPHSISPVSFSRYR